MNKLNEKIFENPLDKFKLLWYNNIRVKAKALNRHTKRQRKLNEKIFKKVLTKSKKCGIIKVQ